MAKKSWMIYSVTVVFHLLHFKAGADSGFFIRSDKLKNWLEEPAGSSSSENFMNPCGSKTPDDDEGLKQEMLQEISRLKTEQVKEQVLEDKKNGWVLVQSGNTQNEFEIRTLHTQ